MATVEGLCRRERRSDVDRWDMPFLSLERTTRAEGVTVDFSGADRYRLRTPTAEDLARIGPPEARAQRSGVADELRTLVAMGFDPERALEALARVCRRVAEPSERVRRATSFLCRRT